MYPGSVPLIGRAGLVKWAVTSVVRELAGAARRRDREAAMFAVFHVIDALAWELGRLFPNERPVPDSSIWKRLGLYR